MARPRRFPWSRRAPADTTVVRGAPRRAVREDYVEDGPPPPPAGPPPREWWPWLLALALLVVGALVGWLLFHNSGGSGTTTSTAQGTAVPTVIGLTEVKATARITQAGLRSQIKRQTSQKAKDTVFSQSPAAGTHVDPGAVVTMIVSAGRSGVEVPDVVGLRTAAAVTKLRAAGFKSKATEVFSTKPSGTVVAQNPAAGDRAEKGSQVQLGVSKGQKRAQVPDVVGQPSADAQAALKTAGFAYTIVVVPSDQARGTVVSQAPAGGTTAPQGSKVRLNVASGTGGGGGGTGTTATTSPGTTTTAPASVAVPRVVGLNQTVAQRRLQAVGLASNVVYVASTQPAGRVVAQRPAPGTKVKRGSRVRLNVSTGPNPQAARPVPDVAGQDEATATTTLQNAGFVVEVIDQPTTDQTQDGIVLDEQPAGGTRAPRGSVVTIYVGRFSG